LPEASAAVGVDAQAPFVVKAARITTDRTINTLNRAEVFFVLLINFLQFSVTSIIHQNHK
jgi:hypothetical protein